MGRDLVLGPQLGDHVEGHRDHGGEEQEAQLGAPTRLGPPWPRGQAVGARPRRGGPPHGGLGHAVSVAGGSTLGGDPPHGGRRPLTLEQTSTTGTAPATGPTGGAAAPDAPRPAASAGRPTSAADIAAFGYQRFTNRELSRLDFGARLLDLSDDPEVPLLERVKFMAIFSDLLDEFFQVRVAGLDDQVAAGVRTRSIDGLRPGEQLRGHPGPGGGAGGPPGPDLPRPARPGPGRGRGAALGLVVARRRRPQLPGGRLPTADLPGAHPPGRRPGPPLPLHLEPLAQPVGGGGRPRDRRAADRPGQGAPGPAPLRGHARRRAVRPPRAGDRRPPRRRSSPG